MCKEVKECTDTKNTQDKSASDIFKPSLQLTSLMAVNHFQYFILTMLIKLDKKETYVWSCFRVLATRCVNGT